ncbi:MAG: SMI1/KNR4 family protein [Proteobacteria bacterium]|nr:MAG: SMI1/KNR4 family protein [Pseudomonadota bacterium]
MNGEFSGKLSSYPPARLTEADIMALEATIGNRLPADYREFLQDYGGYRIIFSFYGVMLGRQLDFGDWHQLYHEDEIIPIAVNIGAINFASLFLAKTTARFIFSFWTKRPSLPVMRTASWLRILSMN